MNIQIDITKNSRWPVYFEGCRNLGDIDGCNRILETGRIRTASAAHFEGDGWSTIFFGLQSNVCEIVSIDIDPKTEQVVRDILGSFADRIKFYNKDSLSVLNTLEGFFEGVLLDSGEDQILHRKELIICLKRHLIGKSTIIFLDDNNSKTRWTYLLLKKHPEIAVEISNNHTEDNVHLISVWILKDPSKLLEELEK